MPNERQTDNIILKLLDDADIKYFPNGSNILEIQQALATASKRGTNKAGFPEFTAVVKDFVIVIEDKAETKFQANYLDAEKKFLLMDTKSITNYAENGALFYAWKIIQNSNFKKVIAFGCSGTEEKKILIRPIFVNPNGYKILKTVKNFSDFTSENIQQYHFEKVLEKKPVEQVELEDIISRSKQLNEDLRNYGQLRDTEKPLVVSGILLALKNFDFGTENLNHDEKISDGLKVWRAISDTLNDFEVEPEVKKSRLLDQFDFIKNRPYLSQFDKRLAKSALQYFSEYIDSNVITAIVNNSPEDVLGRFYSEFIRYSGGDGQSLGIVLTPRHIAELFCDLAQLKPDDKVFDPCCGTATFLIAAMNKMLHDAKTDEQKISIKKYQLHGIELRDDMFSIATTNMILRGDGKSNLLCDDFLKMPAETLREKNFSVGFMNPPYSQSKKKKITGHLSELKFISHLLDSLGDNARCVVIVPQSAMVGKTSEDVDDKRYILENHTLEGVITLNPQTFYKVGTNPVIAVFTAHKPHDPEKIVKFVDFKDDGYKTFHHIGFLATKDAPERKKHLLQCWHEGLPAPTSFIIHTKINFEDEWLHSFYYFNDEIPAETDFEKTMADYLTFEFNMIVHGRGYLFDDEKKNSSITEFLPPLEKKSWKDFLIKNIFKTIKKSSQVPTGSYVTKENLIAGKTPRITVTANDNGIFDFYSSSDENYRANKNFISVSFLGDCFFHEYTASIDMKVHCLKLLNFELNKYVALFLIQTLKQMTKSFSYGDQLSSTDIVNKKILLPVDDSGEPDYIYMENFMRRIETRLLKAYLEGISKRGGADIVIVPADKKVWKEFCINEIFIIKSGVRLTKNDMRAGKIPFIGSTDSNNGITNWVSNKNSSLDENVLGVNYNGSVVENFYHPYAAIFSDDVKRFHLRNCDDNKYIFLFIKNSILKQKIKFQYGYKFNASRMERQKILLPVDDSGAPDWAYMENYMRRQENLLLKKYLEKKI